MTVQAHIHPEGFIAGTTTTSEQGPGDKQVYIGLVQRGLMPVSGTVMIVGAGDNQVTFNRLNQVAKMNYDNFKKIYRK